MCTKIRVLAAIGLSAVLVGGGYGLWRAFAPAATQDHSVADRTEDTALAGPGHPASAKMLELAMARLHNEAVQRFLAADGNGRGRLVILPKKVEKEWQFPWWSPGELPASESPSPDKKDLEKIHQESVGDFLSKEAMVGKEAVVGELKAWVKDLKLQMKQKDWEIRALDLVGLVTREHPVVYESEKLPNMKELEDVPTRAPDFFESAGLDELQRGENFYVRSKDGVIRMLGAIRATSECRACHRAAEGTLLGAFSYTLRPAQYVHPWAVPGANGFGAQPGALTPKK